MIIKKLVILKAFLYFEVLEILISLYPCSIFYDITHMHWILSQFGCVRITFLAEIKWIQLNIAPAPHTGWITQILVKRDLLFGLLRTMWFFSVEVATSCFDSNCVCAHIGIPHCTQKTWAILRPRLLVFTLRKSDLFDPQGTMGTRRARVPRTQLKRAKITLHTLIQISDSQVCTYA